MMHRVEKPNISGFQNGKNENPPIGPFGENRYFVSTVVRILQRKIDLCSKICTKDQDFKIFLSKSKNT